MSDNEKKGKDVKKSLNEDLNKSLTHDRPKPGSQPPAGRVTSNTQSSSDKGKNKKDD